nr:4-hydroxythreonine-4-phosphate dehydrogenase PdxA [Prevotella sp.]
MEENKKIRVAVTQGDTNGIGYELIFKTFADPEMLELCTPIIYGSPKAAAYHRKALDIPVNFSIISNPSEIKDGRINLITTYDEETKIDFGQATPESGMAALKALDCALSDYRDGAYDVLVTSPLNKSNIQGEGFTFTGHTAYIETSLGDGKKALPILVNDRIRIALVTDDIALKDVASAITKENVIEKATILHNTLKRDFRISNPRVAVLALNPGISEEGSFGQEEQDNIKPAVNELTDKGMQTFGPYAADDFFGNGDYSYFDGILAMYHDQGMAPFKTISPEYGVILSANLPIVRAEADTTVDYEDAGKNNVDPISFRNAIFLAIDVFRNRKDYDEAMQNPLKKLYHEKRDESEKVRFAIPKKHSNAPFYPTRDENNDSRTPQNSDKPSDDSAEETNV